MNSHSILAKQHAFPKDMLMANACPSVFTRQRWQLVFLGERVLKLQERVSKLGNTCTPKYSNTASEVRKSIKKFGAGNDFEPNKQNLLDECRSDRDRLGDQIHIDKSEATNYLKVVYSSANKIYSLLGLASIAAFAVGIAAVLADVRGLLPTNIASNIGGASLASILVLELTGIKKIFVNLFDKEARLTNALQKQVIVFYKELSKFVQELAVWHERFPDAVEKSTIA
ncbi:hypothetical protein KJ780_01760, partial [Candidatus Micrarchaeota archaeon]|nr:hypothetical protein [Candidatus Micrarchaeota archaeon]